MTQAIAEPKARKAEAQQPDLSPAQKHAARYEELLNSALERVGEAKSLQAKLQTEYDGKKTARALAWQRGDAAVLTQLEAAEGECWSRLWPVTQTVNAIDLEISQIVGGRHPELSVLQGQAIAHAEKTSRERLVQAQASLRRLLTDECIAAAAEVVALSRQFRVHAGPVAEAIAKLSEE